jgi:eukaryotic-like serine/threonine-protein kinase
LSLPDPIRWEFGPFQLDSGQHLLFREGELVTLSRRAVDLLAVLLENHGELVEKEELIRRVWTDTFVEESNLAVHISRLRKILSEGRSAHRIETIPRRGYRFLGEVKSWRSAAPAESEGSAQRPAIPPADDRPSPFESPPDLLKSWTHLSPSLRILLGSAGLLFVLALFAWLLHKKAVLQARAAVAAASAPAQAGSRQRDTILLGTIANNTGESALDLTLRQAIAIELEQSPALSLVPDARVQESLHMMGQQTEAELTPDLSLELCQRTESSALVDGWIARTGSRYVLALRAINCRTGNHLADLQSTAAGRNQVLQALGDLTGELRVRMGESLSTVQKFSTPIEEATTPSLEALQAYSMGREMMIRKGESAACVPYFQRAIRLDPDFAMAWAALGNAYSNLDEPGLAADDLRKAYALRESVTAHEKLYIESHYFQFVTGDLPRAMQSYEAWTATYPNDLTPRTNLAVIYGDLGMFQQSLQEAEEAVRIAPDSSQNYANLVDAWIAQDRPDKARKTVGEAVSRGLDSSLLRFFLYDAAFLQQDDAAMQKAIGASAGDPGVEDSFLNDQADTLAWRGELRAARALSARAVESARRSGEKETAAGYELEAAQREALFGNPAEARQLAQAALTLARDRDTQYGAALALALAGSLPQAGELADHLNRAFPEDTLVQFLYLPTIRGAIALGNRNPSLALAVLDRARPYELGIAGGLFPVYVRGLAYLAQSDGLRARTEFDKILAHPGVALNSPIAPLARLQRARACLLLDDRANAMSSYRDLLSLWTNADPDMQVFEAARAEYAKLQSNASAIAPAVAKR